MTKYEMIIFSLSHNALTLSIDWTHNEKGRTWIYHKDKENKRGIEVGESQERSLWTILRNSMIEISPTNLMENIKDGDLGRSVTAKICQQSTWWFLCCVYSLCAMSGPDSQLSVFLRQMLPCTHFYSSAGCSMIFLLSDLPGTAMIFLLADAVKTLEQSHYASIHYSGLLEDPEWI